MRRWTALWGVLGLLAYNLQPAVGYDSCPYVYPCGCSICYETVCTEYPCGGGCSCGWGGCDCYVDYCTACGPPLPYPCNCSICTGFYCADCPGNYGCVCYGVGGYCAPCVTPFECLIGADGPICINGHCILCPCP